MTKSIETLAGDFSPNNIKIALVDLKRDRRMDPLIYFILRQVLLAILVEWDEGHDVIDFDRSQAMKRQIVEPMLAIFAAKDEAEVWKATRDLVKGYSALFEHEL